MVCTSGTVLASQLNTLPWWLYNPMHHTATYFSNDDMPQLIQSTALSYAQWLESSDTTVMPVQLHMCAVAVFASLVGPFGGFIASAIKRAYDIKDFASIIPGHGGFMDRMDCQMLTAMFVSAYTSTFIFKAGQ